MVCSGRRVETGASESVLVLLDADTCSMCVPLQLEEASVVVLLHNPRRMYTQEH